MLSLHLQFTMKDKRIRDRGTHSHSTVALTGLHVLTETFRMRSHRLRHFLWCFTHITAGPCQHCALPTQLDKCTHGGCEWRLVRSSLAFIPEMLHEYLHSRVVIFIHNPHIKQPWGFMGWTAWALMVLRFECVKIRTVKPLYPGWWH